VLTPYPDVEQSDAIAASTQRWVERVVIGLNLCPFAKAVQVKRRIRYAVTAAVSADQLLSELEHELEVLIAADAVAVETTLLIHPLAMGEFIDYHFFMDEAVAALRRLGIVGMLQIAGFHPQYRFAGTDSDDMSNFTNRSPHPMLHLLRESSVQSAVDAFPNASDIFDSNIAKLRTLGYEGWRKL
jgi:hypothetical protein